MIWVFFFLFPVQDSSNHFNLDRNAVAIEGYDPVSYFISDSPQKGDESKSIEYKGVKYLFTNDANKEEFETNPRTYVPAYGGWCAYAMGLDGSKVKIDPLTYKIVDGKLNLFYNFRGNNTLLDWNKNETSLKSKADEYWEQLVKSLK